MSNIKHSKRLSAVFLCLLMLITFMPSMVSAEGSPGPADPGSPDTATLTINAQSGSTAVEGMTFYAYKVASIPASGAGVVSYDYVSPFDDEEMAGQFVINKEMSTEEWRALAQSLDAYAKSSGVSPSATGTSGADGLAAMRTAEGSADLEKGLYLVTAESVTKDRTVYSSSPFLICLPDWVTSEESGSEEWNYAVIANAKLSKIIMPEETPKTSVTVQKKWIGEATHPETVTIELIRTKGGNSNVVETVTLGGKNASDWSKRWNGLDSSYEYTVREVNVPDGYTATYEKKGSTNEYVWTVTNTKNTTKPETGDLTVRKTVSGNAATAADKSKNFSFTVRLKDSTLSGTYGDMTFASGVASFTLKDGESKTAKGLPVGTTYTVTEEAATSEGFAMTGSGVTGTITTSPSTAAFVNTKNKPEEKTGGFTVTKNVTGTNGDKNAQFQFSVTLDQKLNGTYGDLVFQEGSASFVLKDGESKTASGLPEGVKYTVTETSYDGYTVTTNGSVGSNSATGTVEAGKTQNVLVVNDKPETPEKPNIPSTPSTPTTPTSNKPSTPSTPNTPSQSTPSSPSSSVVEKLPQTGQLWWPVSLLAAAGLVLFIGGWKLNRREQKGFPKEGAAGGQE